MHIIKSILSEYIREDGVLKAETTYTKEEIKENSILSELDYPESNAENIASKCAFINEFKTSGFFGNEPAWYAALGVVRHCIDGESK
jgi:hypothetical protein